MEGREAMRRGASRVGFGWVFLTHMRCVDRLRMREDGFLLDSPGKIASGRGIL